MKNECMLGVQKSWRRSEQRLYQTKQKQCVDIIVKVVKTKPCVALSKINLLLYKFYLSFLQPISR